MWEYTMIQWNTVISDRMKHMKPSATLGMAQAARDLQAKGIDVIALSAGEPDFPTPKAICEVAKRAIDEGKTHYVPVKGIKAIETALITKFLRDQKVRYQADEVMCTVGGKAAIMMALEAIINPGDEVIVCAPYWVSYPVQVELCGGVVRVVHCRAEHNYLPDGEDIRRAITKKTKAVIVNSPNNPTGGVFSKAQVSSIADAVRGTNILVISDEIYEKMLVPGIEHFSPAAVSDDMRERTVVITGASKGYAMTGWRVGFVAGPKAIVKAMIDLQGQTTTCLPEFIQDAAAFALLENDAVLAGIATMNHAYEERRQVALRILAKLPEVSVFASQGAFYIWADFSQVIKRKNASGKPIADDVELATVMLQEAHVACVAGSPFGAPGFLRMSIASSTKDIETAFGRIVHWVLA